jgi:hypothetical protein
LATPGHQPPSASAGKTPPVAPPPPPPRIFPLVNRNAFRVLGLPVTSSSGQAHDAEAAVRRGLKLGAVRATDWDFAWLGPLSRDAGALQQAIGELANVSQRLTAKLFWFGADSVALNAFNATTLPVANVPAGSEPLVQHDRALFLLVRAGNLDPLFADIPRWLAATAAWQSAIANENYWAQILNIDRSKGFEPAADPADLATLRANAMRLALLPLIEAAKSAISSGQESIAVRVVEILRSSKLSEDLGFALENEILAPLDDGVKTLGEEILAELRGKLVREENPAAVKANGPICMASAQRIEKELVPRLSAVARIAGANSVFTLRAKGEVASTMASVGEAWTWADQLTKSEQLCKQAEAMAAGTPEQGRIHEFVMKVEKPARRQRDGFKPLEGKTPTLHLQTLIYGFIPILFGTGLTIYSLGVPYPGAPEWQYGTHYFVLYYIPILPLRRYLVKKAPSGGWYFLATVKWGPGQWIHVGVLILFLLWLFFGSHK